MTKADTKYRATSPIRELGFWVTMMLSGMLWLTVILWALLHTMLGPR